MFTKEINHEGRVLPYAIFNIIFNGLLVIGFILEIIPVAYLMTGLIWIWAVLCLYAIMMRNSMNVTLNEVKGKSNTQTGVLPVSFFTRTIVDFIGMAILLYSSAFVTAIGYCIYIASRESLSNWLSKTIEELKEQKK